jgi:hypothetical protein
MGKCLWQNENNLIDGWQPGLGQSEVRHGGRVEATREYAQLADNSGSAAKKIHHLQGNAK